MSDLLYGHTEPSPSDEPTGVKLSPRDLSDVVRLLRLLLPGPQTEAISHMHANDSGIGMPTRSIDISLKEQARKLFEQRRRRRRHFAESMFSESGWDILLALCAVEDSEGRSTTTGLAEMADLPLTTALRWLDHLERERFIERTPSKFDRRVMYIDVAPLGRETMNAYLKDIAELRL